MKTKTKSSPNKDRMVDAVADILARYRDQILSEATATFEELPVPRRVSKPGAVAKKILQAVERGVLDKYKAFQFEFDGVALGGSATVVAKNGEDARELLMAAHPGITGVEGGGVGTDLPGVVKFWDGDY